jgi:hypothetical protein
MTEIYVEDSGDKGDGFQRLVWFGFWEGEEGIYT